MRKNLAKILRSAAPEYAGITLLVLVSLLIHGSLITRFSYDLWTHDWFSSLFNHLAESLLKGKTGVPQYLAAYEGYTNDQKTVIYFGIFPAVLRVPFVLAGYATLALGRLSCLIAGMLFALGATVLLRRAGPNGRLNFNSWRVLAVVLIGSPALFLSLWGAIYHESLWWALTSSCWALIPLTAGLRRGALTGREYGLLGFASAVCLCSRITFALPLLSCAAWLLLRQLRSSKSKLTIGSFSAWLIPVLFAALVCAWYNYDRYGSPLTLLPPPNAQHIKISALGGHFNFARITSNIGNYFGFTTLSFSSTPPYLRAHPPQYSNPEMFYSWKEDIVSISMTSPLLVILAIIAIVSAIRNRRLDEIFFIACFSTQVALILCYYAATMRYTAEILPLLLLCAALVLHHQTLRIPPALISLLMCLSLYATIATSITWEMKWRYQRRDTGARVLSVFIRPQVHCPYSPAHYDYLLNVSELGSTTEIECIPFEN